MEKLLASLFLIAAQFSLILGNFYFTYGLWPKSWGSFAIFIILGMINTMLLMAVRSND